MVIYDAIEVFYHVSRIKIKIDTVLRNRSFYYYGRSLYRKNPFDIYVYIYIYRRVLLLRFTWIAWSVHGCVASPVCRYLHERTCARGVSQGNLQLR